MVRFGTKVNVLFTIEGPRRYAFAMLLLAIATVLASSPSGGSRVPVAVSASAQATVRIVSGAVLRLGEGPMVGEAPLAQATRVHLDGAAQPAKLIEFE